MLSIKRCSVAASTKAQDAGKKGVQGLWQFPRLWQVEPKERTVQMLVHPPVTVGITGRSARLHCFYSNLHFIFHNAF